MKKFWTSLLIFLVLIELAQPMPGTAAAEFNPNFILSDQEMQHYTSMSREDIQAFLDHRGGYISIFQTEDVSGTLRHASDIIYRAAEEYRINPKYILVKLQKEQSR